MSRSSFQSRARKQHQGPRFQAELLEDRSLLSTVLSPNGTLVVDGTVRGDTIAVDVQTIDPGTPLDSTDDVQRLVVTVNGTEEANHLLSDVRQVEINGGNGHDSITVDDELLLSVTANGGNGHDSIDGGGGDDLLLGGNGKDWLDGAAGNDDLRGGNSADHLAGGLGNDSLDGGNGPDVLTDPDGDANLDGGLGPDTINGAPEDLTATPGNGKGKGKK